MTACSTDNLILLLEKRLDLNGRLEVFDHLDMCKACRDTIYHLSRKRDVRLFVYKPYIAEGDVA